MAYGLGTVEYNDFFLSNIGKVTRKVTAAGIENPDEAVMLIFQNIKEEMIKHQREELTEDFCDELINSAINEAIGVPVIKKSTIENEAPEVLEAFPIIEDGVVEIIEEVGEEAPQEEPAICNPTVPSGWIKEEGFFESESEESLISGEACPFLGNDIAPLPQIDEDIEENPFKVKASPIEVDVPTIPTMENTKREKKFGSIFAGLLLAAIIILLLWVLLGLLSDMGIISVNGVWVRMAFEKLLEILEQWGAI